MTLTDSFLFKLYRLPSVTLRHLSNTRMVIKIQKVHTWMFYLKGYVRYNK